MFLNSEIITCLHIMFFFFSNSILSENKKLRFVFFLKTVLKTVFKIFQLYNVEKDIISNKHTFLCRCHFLK